MDQRKRVRRGESFGRTGVDRSLSNSLKCPSRQKQRCTTASSNPVMSTTTHEQCDSMTTAITNDTTESIAPRSSRSRSVRFAEETPLMYLCSNFDKNCSPEDYEKRKKELWYSVRTRLTHDGTGWSLVCCHGFRLSHSFLSLLLLVLVFFVPAFGSLTQSLMTVHQRHTERRL